jgi:60 kDa SS-A/Ro ribonucleoprotein
VQKIVDALDAAFYKSFGFVQPTGKRIMLALDVSGSMSANIAGTGLSCREACAALALVTANVEPNYEIVGFTAGASMGRYNFSGYDTTITPLAISPRQRLDDVVRYLGSLHFGNTDCALPMIYAEKQKLDIDAFCVYTDNETWAGGVHPSQALRSYRNAMSKPQAAEVVVGMTATEFTIADPKDPRTLDVVGFDMNTPSAISAFVSQ